MEKKCIGIVARFRFSVLHITRNYVLVKPHTEKPEKTPTIIPYNFSKIWLYNERVCIYKREAITR